MRWAVGLAAGLGLAMAASSAWAGHAACHCPPPAQAYHDAAPSSAHEAPPAPPRPAPPAPPPPPPPPPPPLTIGERYTLDSVWADGEGGLYMHGYRAAPCRCRTVEAVRYEHGADARRYERTEVGLSDGFFADAGGVGPIPPAGYYDSGTYVFMSRGHDHSSGWARMRRHGGFNGGGKRH